jgi:hypothetical protein
VRPTFVTPPEYQIRLDQVLVSGLGMVYRDMTVTPPLTVPLNGLDLDLQGLMLPVPEKPSPVRFNAIMTAGRVPIEGRDGNALERFLFQELTASGHITPGPNPDGWIKAGIKGFEMRALSGLARRKGIQIRNGLMDVGVDVRLKPSRQAGTHVKLAFTDLSLRDSSDGIVAKVLLLPVSLDAAIYMLQGLDGTFRLNVPFTMDLDTLSPKQLNTAIVGATAAVLGKAIATSPVKLLAGTGKLVSGTGRLLTGNAKPKPATEPVEYDPLELIYEPGALALNNALRIQIDILAKRMRRDRHLVVTVRHQFGLGDLIVAERLANPSPQDSAELLNQLQHLKTQMQRQRVDLTSRAQAAYGAGDVAIGHELSQELAEQDNKLGLLEQACDNLLESLGPGSAQLERRRTREAALSLARARLLAVRDALYRADIKDIENRLTITQPSFATPDDNQPGRIVLTTSRRTVK